MNSNPHSDNQTTSFFQRRSTRYWLTLWVIIYTLILIVGIFSQKGTIITIIKLTGVLLCSVYSIAVFPCDKLLQFAMMTTFVADCLLAIDNISVIGLMVFFIAQIIHLYRLSTVKNRPYIFVLSVIGLFIIACGIYRMRYSSQSNPTHLCHSRILRHRTYLQYRRQSPLAKASAPQSLRQCCIHRLPALWFLRPLYCRIIPIFHRNTPSLSL